MGGFLWFPTVNCLIDLIADTAGLPKELVNCLLAAGDSQECADAYFNQMIEALGAYADCLKYFTS